MAKKVTSEEIIEKDIFANVRESAKAAEASIKALESALGAVSAAAKNMKASTPKNIPVDAAGIEKLNEQQARSNALAQARQQIDKGLQKEKVRLSQLQQQNNMMLKDEIALENSSVKTYDAQSKALNALRRQYKDLALQKKENTKEAKELLNRITALDTELKSVDATTGQFTRNVGNYGSAFDNLRGKFSGLINVLGQFGVALGGVTLLKNAVGTISQFSTSIQDLQAITGASGDDLVKYKEQAIEMGKTTQGGAAAVVEAYKLIGSAKPELLESADSLIAVTDAARTLSKASGMELPEAATALTDAMNQFGAPAKDAAKFINVLAAGSKFGAVEIPQVTEALLKFGAVAKTSNVNIEESTALIELLGEKGLKGAEAGTALRNVMLKLSAPDALPKEAQMALSRLGVDMEKLKDTSVPFSKRLEALKPILKDNAALVKTFGTENAVAATTLLSNIDRIKELNGQVTGTNTAYEQAEVRSKTLSEAANTLKETWNGLILEFSDGIDASGGLAGVLDFLSRNLKSVIYFVIKGVQVWATYKAAMLALKMAERVKEFMNYSKALKDGATNAEGAAQGAKKFGMALKGIGMSVAITLAIELATALYDIASGAAAAEEAQKRLDATLSKSSEAANNRMSARQDALNKELAQLQRLRNENKITEAEFLKQKTEALNVTRQAISEDIRAVAQRKAGYAADLMALQVFFKKRQDELRAEFGVDVLTGNIYSASAILARGELEKLQDQMAQLRANVAGADAKIKIYRQELDDTNESTKDATSELKVNTIEQEDNTNKIKAKVPVLKEANKELESHSVLLERETKAMDLFGDEYLAWLEGVNNATEERKVVAADIAVLEAEIALAKAKQTGDAKAIADAENAVLEAKKKQILAQRDFDLYMETDPAKRAKIEKQAELDLLGLQTSKSAQDKSKKSYGEYLDYVTKLFVENADKRIKKIEEEMAAAQKQADMYRQMAAEGNITAKESLAEQDRLIAEANKRKEREERRKQRFLMVSSFLQAYNSNLAAGDNSTTAFAKAVTSKELVQQFIAAMPAFLEGIEDTGRNGSGLDGKGGFVAMLHPNERVVPKHLNDKMKGYTNEQLAGIVESHRIGKLIDGNQLVTGWESAAVVNGLMKVSDKIASVEQAILNKPESNIELGQIGQHFMDIVHTTKTAKLVTRKTFRVNK